MRTFDVRYKDGTTNQIRGDGATWGDGLFAISDKTTGEQSGKEIHTLIAIDGVKEIRIFTDEGDSDK